MDSSLTNRTSSYLPGNSLMLFHFHLLGDHELAALCPVLEAIVRRRTAVVRHWYQLYAQHFGDRRSLAGSEFVRLFESSLEHSLTALVENNVGKFASEVIALGELLVERRVPLGEAVAALGLFEPSVHAVFPRQSSAVRQHRCHVGEADLRSGHPPDNRIFQLARGADRRTNRGTGPRRGRPCGRAPHAF